MFFILTQERDLINMDGKDLIYVEKRKEHTVCIRDSFNGTIEAEAGEYDSKAACLKAIRKCAAHIETAYDKGRNAYLLFEMPEREYSRI